jgi:hypothetical protein
VGYLTYAPMPHATPLSGRLDVNDQTHEKVPDVAQEDVRRLRTQEDPAVRARDATRLLGDYQAAVTELSRIRREALEDLKRKGYTQTDVARLVGLSRGRIGQLASTAPAPERGFFGDDDLTAIVAQKQEAGSRRPVVAAETVAAASRLQALAASIGLGVHVEHVPPPGLVNLNRDNLVVLGGPRVLPIVGQLMQADPYLQFQEDADGKWYLHNADTEEDYRSSDSPGNPRDYGYLGRLSRPDGRGSFLVAAGIHPIGLLGTVSLLETDLAEVYGAIRDARFSLAVECSYDPDTLTVLDARRITPIYRHPARR